MNDRHEITVVGDIDTLLSVETLLLVITFEKTSSCYNVVVTCKVGWNTLHVTEHFISK